MAARGISVVTQSRRFLNSWMETWDEDFIKTSLCLFKKMKYQSLLNIIALQPRKIKGNL